MGWGWGGAGVGGDICSCWQLRLAFSVISAAISGVHYTKPVKLSEWQGWGR